MTTKYERPCDVPDKVLISRVKQLSTAITQGRDSFEREFTMRVPAECDRDADLVLYEIAGRYEDLLAKTRGEE